MWRRLFILVCDRRLWKLCVVYSTPVTLIVILNWMTCASWQLDAMTICRAGLQSFTDLSAPSSCSIQPSILPWTFHMTSSRRTPVRLPSLSVHRSLAGAEHSSIKERPKRLITTAIKRAIKLTIKLKHYCTPVAQHLQPSLSFCCSYNKMLMTAANLVQQLCNNF